MTPARIYASVVLGLRVAYGAGLVIAPKRLAEPWLGAQAGERAPVTVPLRGLGMREVALHGAALGVAAAGGPLRPWLSASLVGDVSDAAFTALGRRGLPPGAAPKTAAAAGGAAALTVLALALVDA